MSGETLLVNPASRTIPRQEEDRFVYIDALATYHRVSRTAQIADKVRNRKKYFSKIDVLSRALY